MAGLLDALSDPAFMDRLREREQLVGYVAGKLGTTYEATKEVMDAADEYAMRSFFVGNSVPFEFRH